MNGYLVTCEGHETVIVLSTYNDHKIAIDKYLDIILFYNIIKRDIRKRRECIYLTHKEGLVFDWKLMGYDGIPEEYKGTITGLKTIL